jgi:hypothetical protein
MVITVQHTVQSPQSRPATNVMPSHMGARLTASGKSRQRNQ